MAQFFTLEEAAIRLGVTPEEFRRRLREDWKTLRSLRDGATLRFRSTDIEELSRSLGNLSQPELQLNDPTPLSLTDSSDEMLILPPDPPKKEPKSRGKKNPEPPPLQLDDSDETIFTIPASAGGSGVNKRRGDSDVRLDKTPSSEDATGDIPLDLDLSGPRSGILKAPSSNKLKSPGSAKIPGPVSAETTDEGSSEFELSLDDSGSDSFELTLEPDSSEEVDIGGSLVADDRAGQSGIDLGRPMDSGVSLEKKGPKTNPKLIDESSEFDLSLEDDEPVPSKSGRNLNKTVTDSDSEFELDLNDDSGITESLVDESVELAEADGDIFETDFELPPVSDESASEVVALDDSEMIINEEMPEITLDEEPEVVLDDEQEVVLDEDEVPLEDESASQVMLVDDEELLEEDLVVADGDVEEDYEDDGSAAAALAGVDTSASPEENVQVHAVLAQPARWGILPNLFLVPAMLVLTIGTLMTFEMVRGMWGYQKPVSTADSLIRSIADNFDIKATD